MGKIQLYFSLLKFEKVDKVELENESDVLLHFLVIWRRSRGHTYGYRDSVLFERISTGL